jgi:DNA-binding protein HU-beta
MRDSGEGQQIDLEAGGKCQMNKTGLIDLVAQKTVRSKKNSGKAVNALLSCMADELTIGGKIRMNGFGTFKVRERAARICRTPRTQEPVSVSATRAVAFRPGKKLKDLCK